MAASGYSDLPQKVCCCFFSWWLVMVVRGNQIKCIDVNDSDISLIALTSQMSVKNIRQCVKLLSFFDCGRQHHDLSLGTGDKCQVFVIEINCMIFYIFPKIYIFKDIYYRVIRLLGGIDF